jgi:hypothetical protein
MQNKYDTSTPERKIAALSKILWDNFAYIDSSIYKFIDLPFNQFLTKATEIVRANIKKSK